MRTFRFLNQYNSLDSEQTEEAIGFAIMYFIIFHINFISVFVHFFWVEGVGTLKI